MIDDAVRDAFEGKVGDLTSGAGTLQPLIEALAGGDGELLQRYRDLGGCPDARSRRFATSAFAKAEPGTLGAEVIDRQPDGDDVEALEVWRAVLGYGDDLLADCRLNAFSASQNRDVEGTMWIPVLLARVAFVAPETSTAVGDALAGGWLDGRRATLFRDVDWAAQAERPLRDVRLELGLAEPADRDEADRDALELLLRPGTPPAGLWPAFWTAAGSPVDPATITPLVASFGATFDDRFKEACARAVLRHEGQRAVAGEPWWPRLSIDSLRRHPEGTLGHAYYHLIVDNGFDPEVLDPETVSGFHPVLDASNRRILQTHEIWHLVAGYSTSPLHEVAISGFQLAQFGHNYSAMFLATATTLLALHLPMFLDPILQVTFEGWRHGRRTRPLMPIDWFSLWGEEIETLRERFGIEPFASAVPDYAAAA